MESYSIAANDLRSALRSLKQCEYRFTTNSATPIGVLVATIFEA